MADFIPTKGYKNCEKCGGWQVIDKTMRKPNGWPIGPIVMKECDNCAGAGQIKIPIEELPPKPIIIRDSNLVPVPWGTPVEIPNPVKVEGWGKPKPAKLVDSVKEGWANYDKQ